MRAIIPNRAGAVATLALGFATIVGGVWTLQATAPRPRGSPAEVLARRPMFGQAWLDLAANEFRSTGALSDFGRAALARAHDLSPNEGQWMVERVLLGVSAWTHLTPALKANVASDLAGVIDYLPEPRPLQFRLAASAMTDADRADLRARLLALRVADARLVGIGL